MNGGVELIKDHILPAGLFAEHLSLPAGPAGPGHRCYAVVDLQVTIGLLGPALAVAPQLALRAISIDTLFYHLP